jgi:hypothetical protein
VAVPLGIKTVCPAGAKITIFVKVSREPSSSLGRPASSWQKVSERLLVDLAEVWEEHGKVVLTKLAVAIRPGSRKSHTDFCLDVFVGSRVSVGGLDPDAYVALPRLLDVIACCGANGDPQRVFEMIEEALRARMAVPVVDQAGASARQP